MPAPTQSKMIVNNFEKNSEDDPEKMELRPEVYTVFNRRMKLVSVLMLECSSKPKLLIVFIEFNDSTNWDSRSAAFSISFRSTALFTRFVR